MRWMFLLTLLWICYKINDIIHSSRVKCYNYLWFSLKKIGKNTVSRLSSSKNWVRNLTCPNKLFDTFFLTDFMIKLLVHFLVPWLGMLLAALPNFKLKLPLKMSKKRCWCQEGGHIKQNLDKWQMIQKWPFTFLMHFAATTNKHHSLRQ